MQTPDLEKIQEERERRASTAKDKHVVTPIEMIAREEWVNLHKDLEPQFEKVRRNENWHYWLKAFEKMAAKCNYRPTLKEWKAAKDATKEKG